MEKILVVTLVLLLVTFFAKEAFQYFYFRSNKGATQPPEILESIGRVASIIGSLELSIVLFFRFGKLFL